MIFVKYAMLKKPSKLKSSDIICHDQSASVFGTIDYGMSLPIN